MAGEKYDQEFFLALAAKGKDVWNAWRRDPANKNVRVTFTAIDFSEAPRDQIDFSGFEFGDFADFSACNWRGVGWSDIGGDVEKFAWRRACFTGAAFGDFAIFTGAAKMHAPPAGRLSNLGDRAKPLFGHPRLFHRPCLAQLF